MVGSPAPTPQANAELLSHPTPESKHTDTTPADANRARSKNANAIPQPTVKPTLVMSESPPASSMPKTRKTRDSRGPGSQRSTTSGPPVKKRSTGVLRFFLFIVIGVIGTVVIGLSVLFALGLLRWPETTSHSPSTQSTRETVIETTRSPGPTSDETSGIVTPEPPPEEPPTRRAPPLPSPPSAAAEEDTARVEAVDLTDTESLQETTVEHEESLQETAVEHEESLQETAVEHEDQPASATTDDTTSPHSTSSNQTAAELIEASRVANRARRYASAEQYARQALVHDPPNATAAYRIAVALHRQRRRREALQWARQSAAWAPEDHLPVALQGDILTAIGQFREAATAYERALAINPEFTPARNHLARLRERMR